MPAYDTYPDLLDEEFQRFLERFNASTREAASIQEIAESLGQPRTTISDNMRGRGLSVRRLIQISAAVGNSPAEPLVDELDQAAPAAKYSEDYLEHAIRQQIMACRALMFNRETPPTLAEFDKHFGVDQTDHKVAESSGLAHRGLTSRFRSSDSLASFLSE